MESKSGSFLSYNFISFIKVQRHICITKRHYWSYFGPISQHINLKIQMYHLQMWICPAGLYDYESQTPIYYRWAQRHVQRKTNMLFCLFTRLIRLVQIFWFVLGGTTLVVWKAQTDLAGAQSTNTNTFGRFWELHHVTIKKNLHIIPPRYLLQWMNV